MASTTVGMVWVVITAILLYRKFGIVELLTAFWFLLVFSDSAMGALRFSVSAKSLYVLLLTGITIIHWHQLQFQRKLLGYFVPFFVVVTITTIGSGSPYMVTSLQKELSYMLLILTIPMLTHFLSIHNQKKFYQFIIYGGALVLLMGLVLMVLAPALGATYHGRFNGIFRNPNGVGIFSALFGIICFFIFSHFPSSFPRQMRIMVIAVIVLSLLLSASRNGLATLTIFIVLTFISRYHRFLGVVVAAGAIFAGSSLYITIIEIIESAGYEEYFRLETLDFGSGRFYAWEAAWYEINELFFWTGEGFAYAEESKWLEKYYLEIPELVIHEGNIHNSFLTLWMNTGLIGLILFMLPLLIIFGKAYGKTYYAVPVFVATMFLAFFESWLVASLNPFTIQFWMILTFMLTYNTLEVQEAYRKEVEKIK